MALPQLTAIITLNRSAKIRVRSSIEQASAVTSAQTNSGANKLFFATEPAFEQGDHIVDYDGGIYDMQSYVANATVQSVSYNSGTSRWEVTISQNTYGTVTSGTEIRVVREVEPYLTHLDPYIVQWIDVTDPVNATALNHHASIGQYLTIGNWQIGNDWFPQVPPMVNLKTDYWWLSVTALNRSVKIKLWGYSEYVGDYGKYDITTTDPTYIAIGTTMGLDEAVYNRKQLNRHSSIGQYIQAWGDVEFQVGIKSLNQSAKVRVRDYDGKLVQPHSIQDRFNVTAFSVNSGNRLVLTTEGSHNVKVGEYVEVNGLSHSNERQRVTVTATGGTFTLTYSGQTTAAIAYNASAATVATRLIALSNIGPSDVAVTGVAGGPYTVTFQGDLAETNVAELTANGASLTGPSHGVAIATLTAGGTEYNNIWPTTQQYQVYAVTTNTITCNTELDVAPEVPATGVVIPSATFVNIFDGGEVRKHLNYHKSVGQWIVTDFEVQYEW
jgi:hypothetical protein